MWWIWKENKKQSFIDRKKLFFLLRSAVIRVKAWRQKPEYCWTQQLSRNSCLIMFLLRTWISKGLFYTSLAFFTGYRVFLKFSDTWNELLAVNWFISDFFWRNTKWKKVSSPHYLKSLMKWSKHVISHSLKRDPRSISKITFYANLRVSPIGTEIW